MKIHTSLTRAQMYDLMHSDDRLRDIYSDLEQVGSRTHAFGYHVKLYALIPTSSVNGAKRRRTNSGLYGAASEYAATFDEWGYWFAALYEADPNARCGGTVTTPEYANREHFHQRTNNAYQPTTKAS